MPSEPAAALHGKTLRVRERHTMQSHIWPDYHSEDLTGQHTHYHYFPLPSIQHSKRNDPFDPCGQGGKFLPQHLNTETIKCAEKLKLPLHLRGQCNCDYACRYTARIELEADVNI